MSRRGSSDDALPEYAPSALAADPVGATAEVLDRELEAFLRSLNQRMGWLYPVEFSHIPMSAYRAMVQLCILDRAAGDRSPEERAQRVNLAPKTARELRESPSFAEVAHAFEQAWDQVAQPKTVAERIADPLMQDKIAQRTIRLALHAGDTRVSVKALEQLNDRAMPVMKQQTETRVLMLTAEAAQLIADTARMAEARPVKVLPEPPPGDG